MMSSTLVRKALELYADDLITGPSIKSGNFQSATSEVKQPKKRNKKKKKSVVEIYREKHHVTYTDKNLDLLQELAKSKDTSKETLRKIVLKSQMCPQKVLRKHKKKPKPQETAFDEEDFKKFEKEYFS